VSEIQVFVIRSPGCADAESPRGSHHRATIHTEIGDNLALVKAANQTFN
jgi:hypothetical protein